MNADDQQKRSRAETAILFILGALGVIAVALQAVAGLFYQ